MTSDPEQERAYRVQAAYRVLGGLIILAIAITGAAFILAGFPANMAIAGVTVICYLWVYETIMDWVDGNENP